MATKTATAAKVTKYVYTWGAGKADGNGSMKQLLGRKGAILAEMTRIGLPVPPGFTMTTEVCTYCREVRYYDEHSADGHLVLAEWLHTHNLAKRWLSRSILPSFRR